MKTEEQKNDVGVEVVQLTPQPVVQTRTTAPIARLGEQMGEMISELSSYLRKSGAKVAGLTHVRYFTFDKEQGETDFEVSVPVAEPVAGEGPVAPGVLPGGPALATWHIGEHDRLGEAYERLYDAMREQGLESNGPTWEVYYWFDPVEFTGTADWPDPSTWRLRLIQPFLRP